MMFGRGRVKREDLRNNNDDDNSNQKHSSMAVGQGGHLHHSLGQSFAIFGTTVNKLLSVGGPASNPSSSHASLSKSFQQHSMFYQHNIAGTRDCCLLDRSPSNSSLAKEETVAN